MGWAFTLASYVLPFLGVVLIITFVHELGHFVVARRLGVRVEAFSVGFGRELLGFTDRHGTRFKLSLLPLGGYVKMFGEQGFVRDVNGRIRLLDRYERGRSFFHKTVAERAAIVFAGPLVNIIFGGAILALLIFANGFMAPSPVVGNVRPDSPAALAGIEVGDRILAVDGQAVQRMDTALVAIGRDPDGVVTLDVRRGELVFALKISALTSAEFGLASVGPVRISAGPVTAMVESVRITGRFIAASFVGIAEIATGERRLNELAGPIRIAEVSGQTFIELGFGALVLLTALLSVNIGIVNLLPIPVLDGGHLVFLAIEALRSRPLSPKVLKFCSLGGLFAILAIFLLTTSHDLVQLGLFD